MRRISHALLAAAVLLAGAGRADAAEGAAPTPTPTAPRLLEPPKLVSRWFLVFGAKYGRIERWGGSLGAGYNVEPEDARRFGLATGPLAAIEVTQGTIAGHVGYGWFLLPVAGLSLRGVLLRGWSAPRVIELGDSYGGVEAKVMLLGFNAFVSGYRRLGSGGPGPGWVADAGLGLFF